MFPVADILPLLERYAFEFSGENPSATKTWVIDTLLDLSVPYDAILASLESLWYADEAPFQGRNRRGIAGHLVYVVGRWLEDSDRAVRGKEVLGGEAGAAGVDRLLVSIVGGRVLDGVGVEEVRVLRGRIERVLR